VDNKVLFVGYNPVNNADKKFSLYPAVGADTVIDVDASYVVPANTAFFLLACNDTQIYNVKSDVSAASGLPSNLEDIRSNGGGWLLMAGQDSLGLSDYNVRSVFLKTGDAIDSFVSQSAPVVGVNKDMALDGRHLLWVKFGAESVDGEEVVDGGEVGDGGDGGDEGDGQDEDADASSDIVIEISDMIDEMSGHDEYSSDDFSSVQDLLDRARAAEKEARSLVAGASNGVVDEEAYNDANDRLEAIQAAIEELEALLEEVDDGFTENDGSPVDVDNSIDAMKAQISNLNAVSSESLSDVEALITEAKKVLADAKVIRNNSLYSTYFLSGNGSDGVFDGLYSDLRSQISRVKSLLNDRDVCEDSLPIVEIYDADGKFVESNLTVGENYIFKISGVDYTDVVESEIVFLDLEKKSFFEFEVNAVDLVAGDDVEDFIFSISYDKCDGSEGVYNLNRIIVPSDVPNEDIESCMLYVNNDGDIKTSETSGYNEMNAVELVGALIGDLVEMNDDNDFDEMSREDVTEFKSAMSGIIVDLNDFSDSLSDGGVCKTELSDKIIALKAVMSEIGEGSDDVDGGNDDVGGSDVVDKVQLTKRVDSIEGRLSSYIVIMGKDYFRGYSYVEAKHVKFIAKTILDDSTYSKYVSLESLKDVYTELDVLIEDIDQRVYADFDNVKKITDELFDVYFHLDEVLVLMKNSDEIVPAYTDAAQKLVDKAEDFLKEADIMKTKLASLHESEDFYEVLDQVSKKLSNTVVDINYLLASDH